MNIVDDADGPLDPRIQIELENLNNATDDINKLEIELDEANTTYGQLLSESTSRLKELMNKLGSACIDKARCYFEACEVAHQARLKCQQQAQLYQRANVVHAAAKETVALAEARFMSHQHEWNFDQAWQDMLNHATFKVMEAENQKAECAREHHKRTVLFHEAEKKVQQLEEKYRRSIIKAQPYFDLKSQCDQKLSIQKEVVDCLKKAVKDVKCSYASSLHALEEISNQIHEKRRDYVNGPREPGVGAELITPEESLNYEEELNKIRVSRVNSIASSEQDADDRNQDFEDIQDLKQRVDHLNVRSVDGSESTSTQWELELQASMEKLKNLPFRVSESDKTDSVNKCDLKTVEVTKYTKSNDNLGSNEKFVKNDRRKQFDDIYQGWQSLTQSPINSIINKSKIAFKNSISKSLSNSPVNIGAFSFGKSKTLNIQTTAVSSQCHTDTANKMLQQHKETFNLNNKDSEIEKQFEASNNDNQKDSVNKEHCEIPDKNYELSTLMESQKKTSQLSINDTQVQNISKTTHSLDSTPVKVKSLSSSTFTNSLSNDLNHRIKCIQNDVQSDYSSSKAKELPLLSFFQKSSVLKSTKDKSCSMINLNEKQNLKALLDHSNLGNIQAISIEKLANARHKLVGDS
ncbi:PREDICTED: SH3 domain-binding protein 5 homolog isoform X2 [Ceratosolen solmsi marchali]|uniref:SH3 domain-binding protein 5 homolog isoform X2 n=1 Tax=Ceratosolen solmsi marchali TaxID=326594 RepID=A0AAJ6YMM2_9HYME|nr:PREDICTED: SH3 domain-binding protein 5 homolog isoform X2 [Ceratosolen solmsi marchali]